MLSCECYWNYELIGSYNTTKLYAQIVIEVTSFNNPQLQAFKRLSKKINTTVCPARLFASRGGVISCLP